MEPINSLCPKCNTYYSSILGHICVSPDPEAPKEEHPVAVEDHPLFNQQGAERPVPKNHLDALLADPEQSLKTQIGGGHYKDQSIQPIEFIHANGLGFIEGSIIKYVSRWEAKGGIEDLKKVVQYAVQLIALEARKAGANEGNRT